MAMYLMTTKLSATGSIAPRLYKEIAEKIDEVARTACPQLQWHHHFAVMAPFDYIDVFVAPDNEAAMSTLAAIRSAVSAEFNVYPAKHWDSFAAFIDSDN